jgi:hypothetical protein
MYNNIFNSPNKTDQEESSIPCSLSLQFFISEWLHTFQILEKIELIVQSDPLQIQHHLEMLLHNPKRFVFSQKTGTIDNLISFLLHFSKQHHQDKSSFENALIEVKNITTSFCHLVHSYEWTKLNYLQKQQLTFSFSSSTKNALKLLFDFLTPYIYSYRSDENLLFFLIENKEKINRALSQNAIEALLKKIYASGASHLRVILQEGYSRRGFESFFEQHKSLIDSIDWD